MRKWYFVALLAVGAIMLVVTVRSEPLANAAQSVSATIIGPLDAQGNVKVHEQGTASVNVANFPSTQQVVGSVGIDANGNGIQEVNSVAVRPFSRSGFAAFGAGNPGAFNAEADLFTVPAGERVVLTYVSVRVVIPGGEHAVVSLSNASFGETLGQIPLTDAGAFNVSGTSEVLTGAGLANIVYDPGDHIVVHAFRSEGDGDNIGQVVAAVTGYTVPTS